MSCRLGVTPPFFCTFHNYTHYDEGYEDTEWRAQYETCSHVASNNSYVLYTEYIPMDVVCNAQTVPNNANMSFSTVSRPRHRIESWHFGRVRPGE